MFVNNILLEHYGGVLSEYQVQGYSISNFYSKIKNRGTVIFHGSEIGLKKLVLPIEFCGASRRDLQERKSQFDAVVMGKSELVIDGTMYSAILESVGSEQYHGENVLSVPYTFSAVKHGPLREATGNKIICDSTLPKTDCILTVTVGASGSNYKLGSVLFPKVTAGEVLCVDGITKRILINGVPAAQRAEWLEFPYLVPGINNIECADPVTVEFYPAYF